VNLIINDNNLNISDIEEYKFKSRALLVTPKNEILIANYGDVYLLPGGSIEEGENPIDGLIRELSEETGLKYMPDDLIDFLYLEYYQANYSNRNGSNLNRLVRVNYFLGDFDGNVNLQLQTLTEDEKESNFRLEIVSLAEIRKVLLSNKTSNPRKEYFNRELMTVLDYYESVKNEINTIKLLKK
jgi:8-oxo-dGTP pyrophosphatase MutT (NUDIX family)